MNAVPAPPDLVVVLTGESQAGEAITVPQLNRLTTGTNTAIRRLALAVASGEGFEGVRRPVIERAVELHVLRVNRGSVIVDFQFGDSHSLPDLPQTDRLRGETLQSLVLGIRQLRSEPRLPAGWPPAVLKSFRYLRPLFNHGFQTFSLRIPQMPEVSFGRSLFEFVDHLYRDMFPIGPTTDAASYSLPYEAEPGVHELRMTPSEAKRPRKKPRGGLFESGNPHLSDEFTDQRRSRP